MNTNKLTIGFLAKTAGINLETIRYYQRIGLITEPKKPIQGYRIYPSESLIRLKFIKRAQQLGFSLAEISELLELGEGSCADVRDKAVEKRKQIERQIKDLNRLHDTLSNLIDTCQSNAESGSANSHCAIVETLSAE